MPSRTARCTVARVAPYRSCRYGDADSTSPGLHRSQQPDVPESATDDVLAQRRPAPALPTRRARPPVDGRSGRGVPPAPPTRSARGDGAPRRRPPTSARARLVTVAPGAEVLPATAPLSQQASPLVEEGRQARHENQVTGKSAFDRLRGFVTVAAQPPQPAVWPPSLVEGGPSGPSRNRVTGKSAFDRLRGSVTVAAQPPQPAVWSPRWLRRAVRPVTKPGDR